MIPTKPTKHCKLCNRCVHWMDHHCLYTLRCVGFRNHFIFVWFNIIIVISQILFLSLLPGYITAIIHQHHQVRHIDSYIILYVYVSHFSGVRCIFVMPLALDSLDQPCSTACQLAECGERVILFGQMHPYHRNK